jgi:dTMP kinase
MGVFITFEGGEACGKSTQVRLLLERLGKLKREVVSVHEPGFTAIGRVIRQLLLHAEESKRMLPETELLLFGASRAQLMGETILPALERDAIVVSDRFIDSTVVYQGYARGLDRRWIDELNRFTTRGRQPDRTVLLDLDVATARRRQLRRVRPVGEEDRMEQQTEDFFQAVRDGYLILAKKEPERFIVVDASGSEETIAARIWSELHGVLE